MPRSTSRFCQPLEFSFLVRLFLFQGFHGFELGHTLFDLAGLSESFHLVRGTLDGQLDLSHLFHQIHRPFVLLWGLFQPLLRDPDLAITVVDKVVDRVLVLLFERCETRVEWVGELGGFVGFGYFFAVQTGARA